MKTILAMALDSECFLIFVAGPKSLFGTRAHALRCLFCICMMAIFAWNVALCYMPGKGFTYFLQFGDRNSDRYLPELKALRHYEVPNSDGYDAKVYVQMAMRPNVGDPGLRKAVDGISYRGRRMLFPWVAWLLGRGVPFWVMHIFACLNIACWFLLALTLFRWFPPWNWGNCARWAAVLFSFGLIFSVKTALLEGPSLLLTAIGMAFLETNRTWIGSMVFGIAGLGRETNILFVSGLGIPKARSRREWSTWAIQAAIVILPIVIWALWLASKVGRVDDIGARNFGPPFSGLVDKLQDVISSLLAERYPYPSVAKFDLLVVVGLMTQFFFFAFRVRWKDAWWRIGASYSVLLVFLGDAVWESYPSAAARVLLPMTLAFNILVPRKRHWAIVLILGNLGLIGSADISTPPGRTSFIVEGPKELISNMKDGGAVTVNFGPRNWWMPERSRLEYWRWSMGPSSISIHNPQNIPIKADIKFDVRSVDQRLAIVSIGGKTVWQTRLKPNESTPVALVKVDLPPGDTNVSFESDRPPAFPGNNDRRKLMFSVRNLEIALRQN